MNTNDLNGAVDRIMMEASGYYIVRFEDPPFFRAAPLRKLEVRSKRRDVTVRGPFPPGSTQVQVAAEYPISGGVVEITQAFPVPMQDAIVIANPSAAARTDLVTLGIGGNYNDGIPDDDDKFDFFANAGLGLVTRPLGTYGFRFRAEARYIYDDFQGAYQFDRDYGVFRYADRRIVVLFQPHRFSRTAALMDELTEELVAEATGGEMQGSLMV